MNERDYTDLRFQIARILHLVFPLDSVRPVEIRRMKIREKTTYGDWVHSNRWGIVTDIVRQRSPEYNQFHTAFYRSKKAPDALKDHPRTAYVRQMEFVGRAIRQAGFEINMHPANVINRNGIPIFIEVGGFHIQALNEYVTKHKLPAGDQEKFVQAVQRVRAIFRRWRAPNRPSPPL